MRSKTKIIQAALLAYMVILFGFAQVGLARAQLNTNRTAPANLPQYNKGVDKSIAEYLCVPSDNNIGTALFDCIGRVYRFGIVAGALALVFFTVWAGYYYMVGGEAAKGKAKGMITGSLTGMVLILGSYVLLRFINPDLVLYKPIQPPIFTGVGLPKCEEVGFSVNCIITSGANSGQVYQGGRGTNYSTGRCSPVRDPSPASISNLTNSCFGRYGAEVVRQASIVAGAESGGNPDLPVGAGSCGAGKRPARCTGGEIPVWGLYQINITVHKVGGLNCPAAFSGGWTCSKSCTVVNQDLYNKCVQAARNATNNINVACELYQKNISAGRPGFWDWGNVHNEHGQRCGF